MLKKKYVKSRNVVKVTFEVPKSELPESVEVKSLHVVGDFNKWDDTSLPMKRVKNVYKTIVELEPDANYQFRYLVNGEQWANDWAADAYVSNDQGTDNCVVETSF